LTAPEAFRFTFESAPERHLKAAELLAPGTAHEAGPNQLAAVLTDLMRDIEMPNGLAEVGYGEADVDDLVSGTMQQTRLLAIAPRDVDEQGAAAILRRSMELW
jgi:hydroxyacid-oxoacid transhydrogenase